MPATQRPSPALEGLNPAQRAAAEHPEGAQLILAGPGSGKTRVIMHRIAWLVGEQHVPPWRILAVTFTNKAAREMRARAEGLLGEDASKLHLGTFHSMCARWLRIHGGDIGLSPNYVIYDDSDQTALMKRVLQALHLDPRQFTPRSVLSAISSAKSEMRGADHFKGQSGELLPGGGGARLRALPAGFAGGLGARLRRPADGDGAAVPGVGGGAGAAGGAVPARARR